MKRRCFRSFLFASLIFAAGMAARAQTNTIVVPSKAETGFLNGYIDPMFSPNHVQLIYPPKHFASAAGNILKITELDFRIDDEMGNSMNANTSLLIMQMDAFPGTMDEIIARESGLVSPGTVLANPMNFLLKKEASVDFTVRLKLDNTFLYDRRRGPLVVEFFHNAWMKTGSFFDCEFTDNNEEHDYSQGAIIVPNDIGPGITSIYAAVLGTKFSYEVVSATIQSVQASGSKLKILFHLAGSPTSYGIVGAPSPEGQYSSVETAKFLPGPNGEVEATLPIESERQFYRVVMR